MSRFFAAVLSAAVFFSVPVAAQTANMPAASTPLAPHSEAFMTTRDGVKLAANVFLPEGKGPWPVILTRTPYLKDGFVGRLSPRYTKAGYVYVVQDVRGKGHSEGFYAAFANDIEDGYDTVEWAARQAWSNGNVGMSGGSAMGITTNMAAIAAPPHLKAAYVIVAPSDMGIGTFINGVYKEKDNAGWLKLQGVSDAVIDAGRAAVIRNEFTGQLHNIAPGLQYVRIPMYNVGGWFDIFEKGNIDNFVYLQNHGAGGARGNQKLFVGPFGHGPLSGNLSYPGRDNLLTLMMGDQEIRWFDHWLKGVNNAIMDEPPVAYFMMAAAEKGAYSDKNRILHAANWPVAAREIRYFLGDGHSLATDVPSIASAKAAYRFDPTKPVPTFGGANLLQDRGPEDQRQIGQRADYLRFQTAALDRAVTITGAVSVELYAATDGPDTDFDAKLVDIYPDGYEALILEAPIRARYRHGFMADDIKMMTPGAAEKLTIDLWSTALTFEKGHRIGLHITSSNAPRFEVNPNTGEGPGSHMLKPRIATNTIYFDKEHPSALVLPVVYPEAAAQ